MKSSADAKEWGSNVPPADITEQDVSLQGYENPQSWKAGRKCSYYGSTIERFVATDLGAI